MSGEVKRSAKVAGRMREELARAMGTLSDPRLASIIVSRVEVTDDLQLAKIYVRSELGATEPSAQKSLLKACESASGKLRREITRALAMRYAPNLRFYYDEAPDQMLAIERVLEEIKSEKE